MPTVRAHMPWIGENQRATYSSKWFVYLFINGMNAVDKCTWTNVKRTKGIDMRCFSLSHSSIRCDRDENVAYEYHMRLLRLRSFACARVWCANWKEIPLFIDITFRCLAGRSTSISRIWWDRSRYGWTWTAAWSTMRADCTWIDCLLKIHLYRELLTVLSMFVEN